MSFNNQNDAFKTCCQFAARYSAQSTKEKIIKNLAELLMSGSLEKLDDLKIAEDVQKTLSNISRDVNALIATLQYYKVMTLTGKFQNFSENNFQGQENGQNERID